MNDHPLLPPPRHVAEGQGANPGHSKTKKVIKKKEPTILPFIQVIPDERAPGTGPLVLKKGWLLGFSWDALEFGADGCCLWKGADSRTLMSCPRIVVERFHMEGLGWLLFSIFLSCESGAFMGMR